MLLPGLLFIFLIIVVASFLASLVGHPLIGGLFLGIALLLSLTFFNSWIQSISRNEKLNFEDLITIDRPLLFAIINTQFILWIIGLPIEILAQSESLRILGAIFNLLLVIFLNPIIEILRYEDIEGVEAIKRSYDFIQEKGLIWLLHFFLIALLVVIFSGSIKAGMQSSFISAYALIPYLAPLVTLVFGPGLLSNGAVVSVPSTFEVLILFVLLPVIVVWLAFFRSYLFLHLK